MSTFQFRGRAQSSTDLHGMSLECISQASELKMTTQEDGVFATQSDSVSVDNIEQQLAEIYTEIDREAYLIAREKIDALRMIVGEGDLPSVVEVSSYLERLEMLL